MKIGLAQINTKTGDFEGNFRKILAAAVSLKSAGADFAVFPELSLCGILPKDKASSKSFIAKCGEYFKRLASEIALPSFVGGVCESGGAVGASNSLLFVGGGRVLGGCAKTLLPNYGAFNEPRFFDKGEGASVVEFMGRRIGLTICEDIWALDPETAPRYAGMKTPLDILSNEKIDLLINASASLWNPENEAARLALLPNVAKKAGAPLAFCNLVGGNDELVFGGGSAVVAAGGAYAKILPKFEESLAVVDLENLPVCEPKPFERIPETYAALKMAFADFVGKSGFKKVVLGLSGGIDSAFVAALACDAIGAENVIGISLPSKFSSSHSVSDAEALAKNCGLKYFSVAIAQTVAAEEEALSEIFSGLARDVTEENLQSRTRGLLLMAVSNKLGAMLLATGNKSECAVGYCTLYGDTNGGFAPIADVYKTDIYALSNYVNRDREIIPQNTILKPPSAELRPGQKDSDSLPEYPVLDAILRAYIEGRKSVSEICGEGFDRAVVEDVVRKFERSEYKRRQLPPSPSVSRAAFGASRNVALTDGKDYEF